MDELNKAESLTTIAKGTRVTADIKTSSDLRIAGIVDGDIEAEKKLILTETGRITGSVVAEDAILEGRFTGEMRILKHITVKDTAFIDGFIFSKSISVEENASVIGIVSVGPDVDVLNAELTKNPKKPEIKKVVEQANEAIKDTPEEESKPAPSRFLRDVIIGIPSGDIEQELAKNVKNVSEDFMKALGFELEIFDEPEFDSFFQKLTYVRKSTESEEDIQELFRNGKESLETALLNKGNTEGSSSLQDEADKVIQLFKQINEFTLVLGDVVLVQQMEDDVQSIAVEMVSGQLASDLKTNPKVVTNPARIYSYIGN